MKSLRFVLVPFVGSLVLAGCGSSTPSGGDGAQVNDQAAKQMTTQLVSAVTKARTGSDGPGAAFALAAAGQAAQGIVTASAGYTAQAQVGEKIGAAHQADVSGSADCTATGCTFKSYADSASGAAWTVDGSLSWASNKVTCDLTMTGDVQGSSFTIHEKCDLTVTDTSIDGTFESDGSYSVAASGIPGLPSGAGQGSWKASVTYNAVGFDASGCTKSGSVDVDSEVTAGGASYSGTGSVTFDGSGC